MDMKNIKVGCGLADPENWPCQWALPPDKNHKTHRCPRRCDHYVPKKEYEKRMAEAKVKEEENRTKYGFENCVRFKEEPPCDLKLEKDYDDSRILICPSPCEGYKTKERKVVEMSGHAKAKSEAIGEAHISAMGLDHKRIEQMLGLKQAKTNMTMARLKEIRREVEKAILLQLKVLESLDVRVQGMLIVRPELPEGQESRDGLMNIQDIVIQLGLS